MSTSNKDEETVGEQGAGDAATGRPKAAATGRRRLPTPGNCRNFIRRETANAMAEIVTTFVAKAKRGSVAHFTSLTKVGGFDQKPIPSAAPKRRRKTLARQLMDEVEKYEARQAAELAAANAAGFQTDDPGSQERS